MFQSLGNTPGTQAAVALRRLFEVKSWRAFLFWELAMGLDAGDKAPAFKIATDDGETLSSSGLKGTRYVVYFYPKDDTSGCTKEAIAFSEALPKFKKAGVTVIGVSKDSAESHTKF